MVEYPKMETIMIESQDMLNCSEKFFDLLKHIRIRKLSDSLVVNHTENNIRSENIDYKTISYNEFFAGQQSRI